MSQVKNTSHYTHDYFSWQKNIGAFGGQANLTKFADYIRPTDKVFDFGCGGGFLLSNIQCAEKIGVEINPSARENASGLGITTYPEVKDVSDEWADIIVSNHALEHVDHPYSVLKELFTKLRPGGKIVFVIPCESYVQEYKEEDINQHLYTWSPLNLGNLFTHAGFKVLESKKYMHKWPRFYVRIAKYFGRTGFDICCRIYGWMNRNFVQVRIIAIRPEVQLLTQLFNGGRYYQKVSP